MAQFKTPTKMKMRPVKRSVPSKSYTPTVDDDDTPKGSAFAGFLWSALLMGLGWIAGVKFNAYWLGLGVGVVLAFVVSKAKHSGRGVFGFIIALLLVGIGLSVLNFMHEANEKVRKSEDFHYRMKY